MFADRENAVDGVGEIMPETPDEIECVRLLPLGLHNLKAPNVTILSHSSISDDCLHPPGNIRSTSFYPRPNICIANCSGGYHLQMVFFYQQRLEITLTPAPADLCGHGASLLADSLRSTLKSGPCGQFLSDRTPP